MAEYVFITTTVMGVYTVYRLGSLFYKNMKKNKKSPVTYEAKVLKPRPRR